MMPHKEVVRFYKDREIIFLVINSDTQISTAATREDALMNTPSERSSKAQKTSKKSSSKSAVIDITEDAPTLLFSDSNKKDTGKSLVDAESDEEGPKCCICFREYEFMSSSKPQNNRMFYVCGHDACLACFTKWKSAKGGAEQCPTCRREN